MIYKQNEPSYREKSYKKKLEKAGKLEVLMKRLKHN